MGFTTPLFRIVQLDIIGMQAKEACKCTNYYDDEVPDPGLHTSHPLRPSAHAVSNLFADSDDEVFIPQFPHYRALVV
jgi:hypothetical protein